MSNNFRVGQKVVCVDDDFSPVHPYVEYPVRGRTYTVSGFCHVKSGGSLYLEELPNRDEVLWVNGVVALPSFRSSRFRPAVDRKEDLSIFYKMLEPKKAGVDA